MKLNLKLHVGRITLSVCVSPKKLGPPYAGQLRLPSPSLGIAEPPERAARRAEGGSPGRRPGWWWDLHGPDDNE